MQMFQRRRRRSLIKASTALAEGGKDKLSFAVKCFEKAVSIYPKFVEARLKLGTALHGSRAVGKSASRRCWRRLKSTKALSMRCLRLSEIYLRQNKLADAEKVLVKGLAIQDQSYLGSPESRPRLLGKSARNKRPRPGKTRAREILRRSKTRPHPQSRTRRRPSIERQSLTSRRSHGRRPRRIRRIPSPRT